MKYWVNYSTVKTHEGARWVVLEGNGEGPTLARFRREKEAEEYAKDLNSGKEELK